MRTLSSSRRKKRRDNKNNEEFIADREDREPANKEDKTEKGDNKNMNDLDAIEVKVIDSASVEETDEVQVFEELKTKADEYLDHLQRLKAEFENYRKRVVREREDSWRRARGDIMLSFIPFVDDLRRLLDLSEQESEQAMLVEGVRLIEKGIMDFMKKEGLEEIDADGKPFDPSYHEAMGVETVDNREKDGLVAEVLMPGFMYRDSLLRPARVRVLKYIEEDQGDKDRPAEENSEECEARAEDEE